MIGVKRIKKRITWTLIAVAVTIVYGLCMPMTAMAERADIEAVIPVSCKGVNGETYSYTLKNKESGQETSFMLKDDESRNITISVPSLGEHSYTLTQVPGNRSDVVYDDRVYTIHIYAFVDDADKICTDVMAYKNQEETKQSKILFENSENPNHVLAMNNSSATENGSSNSGENPQTGDNSPISELLLGLAGSGLVMLGILHRRKDGGS